MRILLWCLLICGAAQAGELYKWVDAEGRTHFSDSAPPDGAQRIRIRSYPDEPESTAAPQSGSSNVVMLTTTWCGVCTRARAYLTSKGIAFTELDVEKSAAGKAEYQRLNGRAVPIILVGGQQMTGFDPGRLEQMLKSTE